ncbi:TetR/AcrR family transcriptional regulator [Aquihabitans daechungensis]|uniref:TetR/AcrR family transcriptional regulator n=1 Tax=Aquihabitans daechungensis TaxID=1052257 RepID=UPI003B9E78A8
MKARPLAERVHSAVVSLLLENGMRSLRTADIARRAQTAESTLFRHFDGLSDILAQTYDRSWALLNGRLSQATFDDPGLGDASELLLRDLRELWALRSDPELREVAMFAFLFLRRRQEILVDDEPAPEQVRFEARIQRLCERLVTEGGSTGPTRSPELLRELILNYAATVWLTWYCMPVDSDDLTGEHDLTPDEAQLGALVLLDRFGRTVNDPQEVP